MHGSVFIQQRAWFKLTSARSDYLGLACSIINIHPYIYGELSFLEMFDLEFDVDLEMRSCFL